MKHLSKGFFKATLVPFLLFLINSSALAQGYGDNLWYFGNSTQSLKFNKGMERTAFTDTDQALPFGDGGSAVATSLNTGRLVFYTDGRSLYDQNHQLISDALVGNNSESQPVVVSHVPGAENQYYIFTKDGSGTLFYYLIEHNPATETILIVDTQSTAFGTMGEALLLLYGGSATDPTYWLIAQSGSELKSFEIGAIGTPLSEVGSIALDFSVSNFNYRSDTINVIRDFWIGLAPTEAGLNFGIINFNAQSGEFTNLRTVPNSNRPNQRISDAEWSNDGRKLYISRSTSFGGNVFQFDTNPNAHPDSIIASIVPLAIDASYGLQMGPDGAIYHLYQAAGSAGFSLGKILQSDSAAAAIRYQAGLFENVNFNGRQFPQFLAPKSDNLTVQIAFNGITCQEQPIQFFAIIRENGVIADLEPESYFWDFNALGTSNFISPVVSFVDATPNQVNLTVLINGIPYEASTTVQISPFNVSFTNLPADTTICELPFNFTAQIDGSAQLFWSNSTSAAANANGTFDRSGTYWVIADNGTCQTFSTLTIQLYGEQKQVSNIWYFGNEAGIDFNQTPAVPLTNSIMIAPEGCATIGNTNGEVLFYTDGQTVYAVQDKVNNTGHVIMPNGDNIGGDVGSIQSSLIIPLPGDETQFYIFTTREVPNADQRYVVKYALVDMKKNAGLGEVILKDITLMQGSTENITANAGGGGAVLFAHELNANVFRRYAITADGISAPEFFTAGNRISEGDQVGYMKLSGNSRLLAQAINSGASASIELHSFDTLGQYDQTYRLTLQSPVGRIYGLDFSPASNKLFATVSSAGNSQLYEFRVDSLVESYMNDAVFVHGPFAAELGAIQRGPDGQTYVAVNGSGNLATIQPNENVGLAGNLFPDNTATRSIFTLEGFNLGGKTSALGLPNFINNQSNSLQTPGILISENACVGTPFELSGIGSSDIDTYQWRVTFNGGEVFTSNAQFASFTPEIPGVYLVQLTIRNECLLPGNDIVAVFTESFEAFPLPIVTNIPSFFVLCNGEATIGIAPEANRSYQWSTGQTESLITVNLEGNYQVTVTNTVTGCSDIANIRVAPPYDVNLGLDRFVCSGDDVLIDAQVTGASYQWFVNNAAQAGATNRIFRLNTTIGGDYLVRVSVQDPADPTCTVSDEVLISVNELVITLDSSTPSTCAGASGTIDVSVTGTNNFSVRWNDNASITNLNRTGLSAGIYTVTITADNCQRSLSIPIENTDGLQIENFSVESLGCDGAGGGFAFDLINLVGTPTFTLNRNGASFGRVPALVSGTLYRLLDLQEGSFELTVTDGAGCTAVELFEVSIPDQVTIQLQYRNDITNVTFDIDEDNNIAFFCQDYFPITAFTTPNTEVIWSSEGPNRNVNFLADANISLRLETGNPNNSKDWGIFSYTVRASEAPDGNNQFFCAAEREVIVGFLPRPNYTVVAELQCDGTVLLRPEGLRTAPPNSSYNYTWTRNGQIIGNQPNFVVSDPGSYNAAEFELTIRYNEFVGCFNGVRPVGTFNVTGPLTVTLTGSAACDDGSPVLLTAETNPRAGIEFVWRNPANTIIANANGPEISVQAEGRYTVEVKVLGAPANCIQIRTFDVVRRPAPVSNLLPRVLFCEDVISLNPGVFESYRWTLPNGTINTSQAIDVIDPGTYRVELSLNGCVLRQQVIAVLDCRPQVIVANAFRPNGSAENRVFKAVFNEYVIDFNINIYNRWGELIFQSSDLNFEWNGSTLRGENAPNGVYAYVMRYKSETNPERGVIEKRGAVTLIR